MTIPEMRPFTDEDARVIKRHPKSRGYTHIVPHGPAMTFTVSGEVMACAGYELDTNYAWMILSPDCVKHPRVLWAIREMLNSSLELVPYLIIAVRPDWPEAVRFATWLGFVEQRLRMVDHGQEYVAYMRVA